MSGQCVGLEVSSLTNAIIYKSMCGVGAKKSCACAGLWVNSLTNACFNVLAKGWESRLCWCSHRLQVNLL